MTTGEWSDAKKGTNENEVIINGVCVMNQSTDFKANDEDEESNIDNSNDEADTRLTIAENDEDEIKRSFIKKPSSDKSVEKSDDVSVKKEIDEPNSWEY